MKSDLLLFHCPKTGEKSRRVKQLFTEIEKWVSSAELKSLIEVYGGKIPSGKFSLYSYIAWLDDFANIWDYRKKQSGGGERWTIFDDSKATENKELIFAVAMKLGFIKYAAPSDPPDYILPLGGARMANFARAQSARNIADKFIQDEFSIVALTGKRPLNEIEMPYVKEYAPLAANEYEAMNGGLEKTFHLSDDEFLETVYKTENINLQWSRRKYTEQYRGHTIYSVAAPSSDPGRRANSYDTFQFFMDTFKVEEGQKIILVTSNIYVPFQLLKFMPISLEKNILVECVGNSSDIPYSQFSQPSNYLQEIKATINAIKNLADLYLH